jgi:hypothetical protein
MTEIREGFVEQPQTAPPPPPSATKTIVSAGNGASPPPPPRQEWPVKIKLRKPIIGNNLMEISELSFREPTAGDILRCGNPVYITATGEVMFDERKMTTMMAHLSNVVVTLLEAMSPKDWETCAYRLRVFFLPDWDSF